jgi:hypothetical protein
VRRHKTDYVALAFGGLFLVVAFVHVATEGSDGATLEWTVPALLVLLGLIGLTAALRVSRPDRDTTVDAGAARPEVSPTTEGAEAADEGASADDTTVLSRDEGTTRP